MINLLFLKISGCGWSVRKNRATTTTKNVLKATQCHFMTNNKVSQGKLALSCHGKISQKDLSFFLFDC